MPNYILEGESYFVLTKLRELIEGKKVEFNPLPSRGFSLLAKVDFNVYIDPDKETMEKINENFIICFLDKNLDLRLDYVKKLKTKSEFISYEPVPSTDPQALKNIFRDINIANQSLPSKKASLKYKGAKQNYEWYDLCLIDDIYSLGDMNLFKQIFESYFDIWKFSDMLWSGDTKCLNQVRYINDKNFEDYFNRIRETSKDYIEVLQSQSSNFYEHRNNVKNSIITNQFRFDKVKEKLLNIEKGQEIYALSLIDQCLMNVREGSNPKIELIKMFFKFKKTLIKNGL